MRIALDATYSLGRDLSGVGIYSQRILRGLAEMHPGPRYLYCYRPHRFLASFRNPVPRGASRTLLARDWPIRVDLFHSLNQRVDHRRSRRVVSTFHDLFVLTAEYSTPEFRQRFAAQARQAAERSDLIIAVSQFTADQVEDLLKVPRSRIRVIHHGVDPAPPGGIREQFVLFVGAIQKRKNIARLVEAFEQTPPGWRLVLAGSCSGFGAPEILQRIQASPRQPDIEVTGYVTAERLESLYRTASIFAFPSLDEGFGMPVLEAMAHGVAVLTSNSSALPEVACDAARLVDARSTEEIAHALTELMKWNRSELIAKALNRSAQFTWKRAVDQTWNVYRELL